MNDERVYLEVNRSSEKRGMYFITCLSGESRGTLGYLSRSNRVCHDLDRYLTGDDGLGAYFCSESDALMCISEFYIIQEKID
jgi:hypothetical protein